MTLVSITDRRESQSAYNTLMKNITKDTKRVEGRWVGYQGGGIALDVYWNPIHRFWTLIHQPKDLDRFWICFGVEDPTEQSSLSITAEANPPLSGVNRRCAGAFLRDTEGRIFLGHSGKIGGGRKGIGKGAFVETVRGGNWQDVIWPDGKRAEMLVLCATDSADASLELGHFVHEVWRFKQGAAPPQSTPAVQTFRPEFHGAKSYKPGGLIEADCFHGLVVNNLALKLKERGCEIGSDRNQDLYTISDGAKIGTLFEVKTDVSTTSIYCAIGQLLFHGAGQPSRPHTVMVLPTSPDDRTGARLKALGIQVMTYRRRGARVDFPELEKTLRETEI